MLRPTENREQNGNAISGTSSSSNSVSTLGQTANNDYNQSQMQDVLNKMDEFITAARRTP
jgi:hypothetical protein